MPGKFKCQTRSTTSNSPRFLGNEQSFPIALSENHFFKLAKTSSQGGLTTVWNMDKRLSVAYLSRACFLFCGGHFEFTRSARGKSGTLLLSDNLRIFTPVPDV